MLFSAFFDKFFQQKIYRSLFNVLFFHCMHTVFYGLTRCGVNFELFFKKFLRFLFVLINRVAHVEWQQWRPYWAVRRPFRWPPFSKALCGRYLLGSASLLCLLLRLVGNFQYFLLIWLFFNFGTFFPNARSFTYNVKQKNIFL